MILELLAAFWQIIEQMAPFMLGGFLLAGLVNAWLPAQAVARHLGGSGWWPIVKATLFGMPFALCSCGILPVAATLHRNGASRGATISFLISSPETGVDSLFVTWGILGLPFALFRMGAALVNGIIGGLLVSVFGGKPSSAAAATEEAACCHEHAHEHSACASCPPATAPAPLGFVSRLRAAVRFGFVTLPRELAGPLLLGLVAAAILTIASTWLLPMFRHVDPLLGIALAILIGLPIYACSTASLPLAASLVFNIGLTPGAALAFLIVGPATNAAAITTLWRLFGPRTTAIYLTSVIGTAFAAGLLLNRLLRLPGHLPCGWCALPWPAWLLNTCAVALVGLLVWPLLQRGLGRAKAGTTAACAHCGSTTSPCSCVH